MTAHLPPGDNKQGLSPRKFSATAKQRIYKRENLAYTEAANAVPPKVSPAERRWRALLKAFYHWVHSRM